MPLTSELVRPWAYVFCACNYRKFTEIQKSHWRKTMNKQSRYTERVHLRLTAEEKQLFLTKAEQANMKVSDYIRALVNNKRIVVAPDLPKLAVQLIKIGVNVNQICNVARKCGTVPQERIEETEKHLAAIQDKLSELITEIQDRKDRTRYKI